MALPPLDPQIAAEFQRRCRQFNRLNMLAGVGFVGMAGLGILIGFLVHNPGLMAIGILAGLPFIGVAWYAHLCWKCPACQEKFGQIDKLRFCPHCGTRLQ